MEGNKWSYHCFNCNFKCTHSVGRPINRNTKQLLVWLGCDDTEIQRWNLESLQKRSLVEQYATQQKTLKPIKFAEKLPPQGQLINPEDPRHQVYVDYIRSRGLDPQQYPYIVTPHDRARLAKRIVIPYTYKNKFVGYTSRFLDGGWPKYVNEQQPGYVFGYDFQRDDWSVCIVVEGVFDALSIDGCALLHNDISPEQARLLNTLQRRIIVVPDRDQSGLELCDRALEYGYSVSIPQWGRDVKDTNDAVLKYGKMYTLLSILESATTSRIKIELARKKIADGYRSKHP